MLASTLHKPLATFSAGRVSYPDGEAVRRDLEPYLGHRVLFVAGAAFPPSMDDFSFELALPGGTVIATRGKVISNPPGTALIQITQWSDSMWLAIQKAAAGPSATPEPAPEKPAQPILQAQEAPSEWTEVNTQAARGLAPLPPSKLAGKLRGVAAAADLAALAIQPDDLKSELGDTSLARVVRWLGARRATGVLTVRLGDKPLELVFRKGRIALTERTQNSLTAAATSSGEYAFDTREAPDPGGARSFAPWNFAVVLTRAAVREQSLETLRAVLPMADAPKLRDATRDLLGTLDLGGPERRFCERRLDGSEAMAKLLKNPGMAEHTVMRLLVLVELLGLIEFVDPTFTSSARTEVDELQATFERRKVGNLFERVGVHHSDPPSRLKQAYDTLVAELSPGAPAEQRSPEYAAKLLALAREAWAVIGERDSRQKYRKETLQVDVVHNAALMAEQAKVANLHGDTARARELLEAACDLHGTPEQHKALRALPGRGA